MPSIQILGTFAINLLLGICIVVSSRYAFSLRKIFGLFIVLFFVIVPFAQYSFGAFPWGWHQHDEIVFRTNIYIGIGCVLFLVTSYVLDVVLKAGDVGKKASLQQLKLDLPKTRIRFLLVTVLLLQSLFVLGPFLLDKPMSELLPHTAGLVIDKVLRGSVLLLVLYIITYWRILLLGVLDKVLFFLLLVATLLPFGNPRYWIATCSLSIIVLIFKPVLQLRKRLFEWSMLTIVLVVFPVMGVFKYSRIQVEKRFDSLSLVYANSYLGGDFDAYASMCNTIQYVDEHGHTSGRQLLGVLLFFIPRSVWPTKPIGSGAMVNTLEGSDFRNFSSPFFAEGYINGGVLGMCLFVIMLAIILAVYDRHYWADSNEAYHGLLEMFYPAALGLLFFVLRGDLLSSFAYTTGLLFVCAVGLSYLKRGTKLS